MRNIVIISLAALTLGACSAQSVQEKPVISPDIPVVSAPIETTPVSEAVQIIDRLDAAGCDFSGVVVTTNAVRKGHKSLAVQCNPPIYYGD